MRLYRPLIRTSLFLTGSILLSLALYFYTLFILSIAPQENATRVESTVKAVCDYDQTSPSQDAWKNCYVAENASNTQYLCHDVPNCWVEEDK